MKHLTNEQRYEINSYLLSKKSISEIALLLCVHKSTISRELRRNSYLGAKYYSFSSAINLSQSRKSRTGKIKFDDSMKSVAQSMLEDFYSPEQIVGRCRLLGIPMVSHEWLYQWIWKDKKKKGILYTYLRRGGRHNRKRGAFNNSRGMIKDRTWIDDREAIVDEKCRLGDLEIDTIIGCQRAGAILTVNDRVSGKLWMRKVSGKDSFYLTTVLCEMLNPLRKKLHTITSDNGFEFKDHKRIAKLLDVKYYFAHPYHSFERGANENLNGLIRQFIPKGTNFDLVSNKLIISIETLINNRPRKRLGYLTPLEFEEAYKKEAVAFNS